MNLSINLQDEETNILEKRSKDNLLTVKEQVEDIIRRSCLSYKKRSARSISATSIKVDDKLVGIFSRENRGRKRKR